MRKLVVLFVFLLNTLCVVAATGQGTKQPSAGKINISGSMVNERGEAVSVLKPNDIVRFKVRSDRDCYIAIMMVDARGEKSWLATVNNFLEAGIVRTFPDIAGATLRASDDGVSGDEYVVIYACTDENGLPSKDDTATFQSQDLHMIMKRQQNAKSNALYGNVRIRYRLVK